MVFNVLRYFFYVFMSRNSKGYSADKKIKGKGATLYTLINDTF